MTYDLWQTTFAFSMASNAATGTTGSASALQGQISLAVAALDLYLGGWKQVWGPVVWQAPGSTVADNAMVVVYNQTKKTYIVAVAATNTASAWDWVNEDLAVQPDLQVAWSGVTGAAVSRATSIGLNQLLAMQSGGKTLAAYLSSAASSSATLIITGHSLAGALSPALALSLFPKGTTGSGWANVYVMPTAGASPGNQAFVTAFASAFPAVTNGGYQNWNVDFVNTLDVVPHAWVTANLNAIPTLYTGLASSVSGELSQLVSGMVAVSTYPTVTGAAYQSVKWATFAGTQQNTSITSFGALMTEVVYQHVKAYISEFGLSSFSVIAETRVGSGVIRAFGG